jgi:hypothetical protein
MARSTFFLKQFSGKVRPTIRPSSKHIPWLEHNAFGAIMAIPAAGEDA